MNYEIPQTLLDAVIQNFETLMNAVEDDQLDPDTQAVLTELHELRAGDADVAEEEVATAEVEEV